MILEIGINNFRLFKNNTALSFKADKRTKHLLSNTILVDNVAISKALAIYGPNSSGKSILISFFKILKQILNGDMSFECNRAIFNDEPEMSFHIIYNNMDGNGWVKYQGVFDSFNHSFISEKLSRLTYYDKGQVLEGLIFEKDNNKNILRINDRDESELLAFLTSDRPFLYTIQLKNDRFSYLSSWKDSLVACSNNIEIVKMFNIPIQKTIDMLKGGDSKKVKFISSFVKSADISVSDFNYGGNIDVNELKNHIDENVLSEYNDNIDVLRLMTTYGEQAVPSIFYDSAGTKKIEAIAAYIYEAINEGKLLIVDELDNGLQFTLTRAIIAIFNNMLNLKGQIIFTAHDLLLIDSKNLFRKDQIYFLNRNEQTTTILSLKELTANNDGLREGDSLVKRYNHGDFGPVPLPNFIKELNLLVKDDK